MDGGRIELFFKLSNRIFSLMLEEVCRRCHLSEDTGSRCSKRCIAPLPDRSVWHNESA